MEATSSMDIYYAEYIYMVNWQLRACCASNALLVDQMQAN